VLLGSEILLVVNSSPTTSEAAAALTSSSGVWDSGIPVSGTILNFGCREFLESHDQVGC
jgi:hypothetical protein